MDQSRRSFLKASGTLAASLAAAPAVLNAAGDRTGTDAKPEPVNTQIAAAKSLPYLHGPMQGEVRKGDMIYRPLGSTGEMVSLIGLGGFHIGKPATDEEAIKLVHAAIDNGINFMDNCWDYNTGNSELRAGKAYKGGYRDKVFHMTKIDGRTRKAAMRQIEECLARIDSDRIDLLQHHEVLRLEDPDNIFMEGGAMEAVLDAKKQGKVRYIGFTGHKDPLVHLRMLQVAKEHDFHFDAVQMPINVADAHFRSFAAQVLPVLVQEKIAPLAMKTFGDPHVLNTMQPLGVTPIEMLQFSMNLPVSVVITGIEEQKILDQALEAVRTYKPLGEQGIAALLEKTRVAGSKGVAERYKTTWEYDGTSQNPHWLGLKVNVPAG